MAKLELAAKPICITGASSGIGRATALACAAAGMPVLCAARRRERLDAVVGEIVAGGGRAAAVVCDVTGPEDCRAMVQGCIAEFGSIYAVFANAGYGLARPMHETSEQELRDIFETNFFGTMNTIRAALPPLLEAGRGHVLICSSSIGKLALPRHGAYCATKGAQWLVGRAMNLELRPRGIQVSTVYPIGTLTEFFDEAAQRSGPRSGGSEQNRQRFMQPAEKVAEAVLGCLRRPRPEVWTSTTVRLAAAAYTACPTLMNWSMQRLGRKRSSRQVDEHRSSGNS